MNRRPVQAVPVDMHALRQAPSDSFVRRAATRLDWHIADAFVRDLAGWIAEHAGLDMATGQDGFVDELANLRTAYDHPSAFFIATVADVPAGGVALMAHPDGSGELKRMYVRPGARGTGVADRLVEAVIGHAAALGLESIWLETGEGIMDAAIGLYRRWGFEETTERPRSVDHPAAISMARPTTLPVDPPRPVCAQATNRPSTIFTTRSA